MTVAKFQNYFETHRDKIVENYFTFLRFKTISAQESVDEMEKCVAWLKNFLEPLDFKVTVWRGESHPVVFAESPKIEGAPTLLIYNHYDVQPIDPLEEWKSPPFEPTLRDGKIFARGAEDNKGQGIYVLTALNAYKDLFKNYPINIKLIIEGDEEIGSRGFNKIIKEHQADLKADYLTIVDLGMPTLDKPSMVFGIRGLITMDLLVEGSKYDLHSGSEGGVILNPIHALCHLLDSCRDKEGKVTIPGFYDGIKPMTEDERKKIRLDFDEAGYVNYHGVPPRGGEKAYSPYERAWIRPTLEVNGITGGYSGPGFKTVIPSKVSAKVSCRLVDGQDPMKVAEIVKNYFEKNAPEGTKVKVDIHSGMGLPAKSKFDSPIIQAALKAYEDVLKKSISFTFEGGSIPITSELAKASGADIAFLGLGLPTDMVHAPNEHFDLDRIKDGFCIIGRMIELLGDKHA